MPVLPAVYFWLLERKAQPLTRDVLPKPERGSVVPRLRSVTAGPRKAGTPPVSHYEPGCEELAA